MSTETPFKHLDARNFSFIQITYSTILYSNPQQVKVLKALTDIYSFFIFTKLNQLERVCLSVYSPPPRHPPRMRAGKNLCYYEQALRKTGKREAFIPRLCGQLCCCCCCCCKPEEVKSEQTQRSRLF